MSGSQGLSDRQKQIIKCANVLLTRAGLPSYLPESTSEFRKATTGAMAQPQDHQAMSFELPPLPKITEFRGATDSVGRPLHSYGYTRDQLEAYARCAIAAYVAAQGKWEPRWQPIKTAPKDGTHILATLPDRDSCYVICWADASKNLRPYLGDEIGWHMAYDGDFLQSYDEPTHWMPLPAIPGEDPTAAPALPQGEPNKLQCWSSEREALFKAEQELKLATTVHDAFLRLFVEKLEIMLCSSSVLVDVPGGDVVGYQVKTGALHSILGALAGRVTIPLGLPEIIVGAPPTEPGIGHWHGHIINGEVKP